MDLSSIWFLIFTFFSNTATISLHAFFLPCFSLHYLPFPMDNDFTSPNPTLNRCKPSSRPGFSFSKAVCPITNPSRKWLGFQHLSFVWLLFVSWGKTADMVLVSFQNQSSKATVFAAFCNCFNFNQGLTITQRISPACASDKLFIGLRVVAAAREKLVTGTCRAWETKLFGPVGPTSGLIVTIICEYKILRFWDSDDFAGINFCDFAKSS